MNTFKITLEDGDFFTTRMNATLEEAKSYYLGNYYVRENDVTGEETKLKYVKVEQL